MEWEYRRVYSVRLAKHHLKPGRVERFLEDDPAPYPHSLTIETYVVVLLDENGESFMHSHPYDLDDAFNDAEYEFGIKARGMEAYAMTVQALDTIQSYHAHIYFDGPEQRRLAESLREEIAQRFSVLIGRWHDRLVGPHTRPMYQVAFSPVEFARFVPWLMINRRGLAVLVHPNTGRPKNDHLTHALWLGEILAIDARPLPDHGDPDPEIVPNTNPTVQP